MTESRREWIDVRPLIPQVSVEQVAAFYGLPLPEMQRVGSEIRCRCFLNCGHDATGDRAVAIKADDPQKKWKCHQYGCEHGGDLLSLMDLVAPGTHMGGRPKGDRFKQLARDLQNIAGGDVQTKPVAAPAVVPPATPAIEPVANVRLKDSPNERARGLVNLDMRFLVEPSGEMNKFAAGYFRKRPYLTPDVCRSWRMGYLPRPGASQERTGGTMQGKIVYAMCDDDGEVLSWFGRDPAWEQEHSKWVASGKQGREPEKFHFVKGFHRGLELYGQHRLREAEREAMAATGLVVVEGPNDVIALSCLGAMAVGLCSNIATDEQVAKIVRLANEHAAGRVTVMLDCDTEGENGAKKLVVELAEHCRVRLAWSSATNGGVFKQRQPESLTAEEWGEIRTHLKHP